MSSEGSRLLGHYENFPTMIHNVSRFTHQSTEKKLQKAILRVFHRLNQEKRDLNVLSPFFSSKCEVSFEFGVAEGATFNYLDEEELKRFQKDITKETLPTLDFFCVVIICFALYSMGTVWKCKSPMSEVLDVFL